MAPKTRHVIISDCKSSLYALLHGILNDVSYHNLGHLVKVAGSPVMQFSRKIHSNVPGPSLREEVRSGGGEERDWELSHTFT